MASYCARSDIESRYGVENVKKWADINADGVAATITTRITLAITNASDIMDSALRGGPHLLPLTTTFSTMPPVLTTVCVQLAAYDLLGARGVEDTDRDGKPLNRLASERDEAMKTLASIHAGKLWLDDVGKRKSEPGVVAITTSRD